MERLTLVLLLLTTTPIVVTNDRRWRWRPRRRWSIKQIPQVVLQLQVRSGSPRNSLDGQVGSPITSGEWGPRDTSGTAVDRRFVLHVKLAQGVHQGAVLVLPALLQQRLGRNVVQIVWRVVPELTGSKIERCFLFSFREFGKICFLGSINVSKPITFYVSF